MFMSFSGTVNIQAVLYKFDRIVVLGGAKKNDFKEWSEVWNDVCNGIKKMNIEPEFSGLALVKAKSNGDIIDRISIDKNTIKKLLGKSMKDLILDNGVH